MNEPQAYYEPRESGLHRRLCLELQSGTSGRNSATHTDPAHIYRNPPLDFTLASLLGFPEWQDLLHGEFICAPHVLKKWTFLKGCLLADIAKAPGWRDLKMKGFSWTETILWGFREHARRCIHFQMQSHPTAFLGSVVSWIFWGMFLLIRVLFVLWLM